MIGSTSIRTRILVSMISLLFVTMVVVTVVVDALYVRTGEHNLDETLAVKSARAQELAATGADARQILDQIEGDGYRGYLSLVDNSALGTPPPGESQDYRYSMVLLDRAPGPLRNAKLTVWMSTGQAINDRQALDESLVLVGIGALMGATILTVLVTDVALKPLEVMASRAKRISDGQRGLRMGSPNSRTEVGRAATAIDDMLDELEGAEARARQAELDARQAHDQMRSFLSDAAHELKTPMAGIKAAAEALVHLPEDVEPEARDELAVLLASEAARGGRLVETLLESARVESGVKLNPQKLDLCDLLQDEKYRVSVSHAQLAVVLNIETPVEIEADRLAITSVIRNLFENAVQAAGPRGWVLLGLDRVSQDGRMYAVVDVVDSGPGIEAADHERVFDRLARLSRTASTTPGAGLGLSIARGYARAHGGDVVYVDKVHPALPKLPTSNDGAASATSHRHGAWFQVTLPVVSNTSSRKTCV